MYYTSRFHGNRELRVLCFVCKWMNPPLTRVRVRDRWVNQNRWGVSSTLTLLCEMSRQLECSCSQAISYWGNMSTSCCTKATTSWCQGTLAMVRLLAELSPQYVTPCWHFIMVRTQNRKGKQHLWITICRFDSQAQLQSLDHLNLGLRHFLHSLPLPLLYTHFQHCIRIKISIWWLLLWLFMVISGICCQQTAGNAAAANPNHLQKCLKTVQTRLMQKEEISEGRVEVRVRVNQAH